MRRLLTKSLFKITLLPLSHTENDYQSYSTNILLIMNFKKIVFSLIMAIAFIAPNFANTNPIEGKSKSKALEEIKEIIQDIDFDISTMTIAKARLFFMVNSHNEVVIIQTSSDEVDAKLKRNLNYKTLDNRDLEVNKVYTLPIIFERQ